MSSFVSFLHSITRVSSPSFSVPFFHPPFHHLTSNMHTSLHLPSFPTLILQYSFSTAFPPSISLSLSPSLYLGYNFFHQLFIPGAEKTNSWSFFLIFLLALYYILSFTSPLIVPSLTLSSITPTSFNFYHTFITSFFHSIFNLLNSFTMFSLLFIILFSTTNFIPTALPILLTARFPSNSLATHTFFFLSLLFCPSFWCKS